MEKTESLIKRNILLYLTGSITSRLGTYMYNFAIGLYVLKLTGSGASLSLAILFGMLPRVILSPFAGAIADRFNRKKMVVRMDLLSGCLMFVMFMLAVFTDLSLLAIYLSSALLTVFNTFFDMAINSSIPNLVDEKRLIKINSMRASVDASASIMGPILGGVLYALIGFKYFLIVNAISFIISGFTEMFINFNVLNKAALPVSDKSILASMKEGFVYLKDHTLLMGIMKYVLFINFVAVGIGIILPYIMIQELHATDIQYGVTQMGFPVGVLIMSILYSLFKKDDKKMFKKLARNLTLFGIGYFCLGLPTTPMFIDQSIYLNIAIIMLVSLLMGFIVIMINIPITTMMQKSIDDAYRGRVNGVIGMVSQLVSPLGIIAFGFLVDGVDSYIVSMVSGSLIILISLLMLLDKKMMAL